MRPTACIWPHWPNMMHGCVSLCRCVADCLAVARDERIRRVFFVASTFAEMGASSVEMADEIDRMVIDDAYLAEWYTFLVNCVCY